MAGNNWINSYLEAIMDVGPNLDDVKSSLLFQERGRLRSRYFMEEVITDDSDVFLIAMTLLFLLNRGDDLPRNTACADHILVNDGEEVPFLNAKLLVVDGGGDLLHELNHFVVAFSLLREFSHVNEVLAERRDGGHFVGDGDKGDESEMEAWLMGFRGRRGKEK
ncbi:hypothetical protein V6N13_131887 [Hibiscus sabdariffa]|uniref:Uncharacterized protein n=1 Tax=Hibiscus sabdariffa TaxID=183260 RepID=A0ABR2DC68_9ROSI